MSTATVRTIRPQHARGSTREDDHGAAGAPRIARAVVVSGGRATLTVALADGTVARATFALALPYDACEGDELLVAGDDRELFVIGVLAGQGKTSLEIPGNVSLRALGGALELSGDEGVSIRGPVVEVNADKLRTVARSVVETFSSFFQRVSEVLHVHAKQEIAIVDEGSYRQAKTASIQAEDTVTINGKEIHLG